MAVLLEDRTKALLARHGLAVPKGAVVRTPGELAAAAAEIGFPTVVKALIPVGKKGKAGAVRSAADRAALEAAAGAILGQSFRGFPAEAVLVETREPIAEELFLSFNFDAGLRSAVMMLGRLGGVDVEEAAALHPEAFARIPLDLAASQPAGSIAAHWARLGLPPASAAAAGRAAEQALGVFRRYDARVLEINPLALRPDGTAVAVGTLMDIDDDALFRQQELAQWVAYGASRMGRPATPLERRLLDLSTASGAGSIRFMELAGGDIGCILSGGGCSLWSADHLIDQGGKPATYYDATAPSDEILRTLFEGVLDLPGVRGMIFGSNIANLSRVGVDVRVRLLVDILAARKLDLARFPVVIRMAGTGQEEARKVAARLPHLEYYGTEETLEYALDRIVRRVRDRQAGGPAA